eukprot:g756.t1
MALVLALALPALALPALASAVGPISIPLERKVAPLGDISKTYYVGHLLVGSAPQRLQVGFETASGSLVLDSTRCNSPACLHHRRYAESAGAQHLNRAGGVVRTSEQAALSDGPASGVVVGDMMRDTVCLAEGLCAEVGFLAAKNMTDDPFLALPVDGLVGLSLEGLSISRTFNFLSCWTHLPQRFALFLPAQGPGEITFGGYKSSRALSKISYVRVKAVYVGNDSLDFCNGGCRAILDSSSSHITVPTEVLPLMQQKLTVKAAKGWLSEQPLCERAQGPSLTFELEGVNVTLDAKDYSALEGHRCVPQLHPWDVEERQSTATRREGERVVTAGVHLKSLILGEPLLRKYYTIFDAQPQPRVGFAEARELSDARRRSALARMESLPGHLLDWQRRNPHMDPTAATNDPAEAFEAWFQQWPEHKENNALAIAERMSAYVEGLEVLQESGFAQHGFWAILFEKWPGGFAAFLKSWQRSIGRAGRQRSAASQLKAQAFVRLLLVVLPRETPSTEAENAGR